MTSDDEKDPPVPADLDDAANRIHRNKAAADRDAHDNPAPAEEPNV